MKARVQAPQTTQRPVMVSDDTDEEIGGGFVRLWRLGVGHGGLSFWLAAAALVHSTVSLGVGGIFAWKWGLGGC